MGGFRAYTVTTWLQGRKSRDKRSVSEFFVFLAKEEYVLRSKDTKHGYGEEMNGLFVVCVMAEIFMTQRGLGCGF